MVNRIINTIRYYAVYRWILSFCPKKNRFLDFGCGKGEFVSYLRQKKWECYGIDPDLETIDANLSMPYKKCFFSSLAQLQNNVGGDFDTIFLNFSLEHCDNPISVLKELLATLAPGGMIFVRVPNSDYTARNKKFSSFQMSRPLHRHYFTPKGLSTLLEASGLSILKVDTRFCLTSALTMPCSIFPVLDPMDWIYEKNAAKKLWKWLTLGALCFIFSPYELLKSQTGHGAIIHAVAKNKT